MILFTSCSSRVKIVAPIGSCIGKVSISGLLPHPSGSGSKPGSGGAGSG
ncbi:MAG: hypothetical protein SFT68_05620 [Rickettsiaceae bacterium]|nr:hypothetical protein [Rickettsiaceae bacterium]